jgi:prepilin-type N-terminal cleavage/methylation domain-containing protein
MVARHGNDFSEGRRRIIRNRRSPGFTLVELLVVVGIIALLVAILIPALSRARESANRTICLSNIRQVATALISYTADNNGSFPFCGLAGANPLDADWVWWQKANGRIDQIAEHGIGPYLNLTATPRVLYCPNDDNSFRPRQIGNDPSSS